MARGPTPAQSRWYMSALDAQAFKPRLCTPEDLKAFHSDDYIDFLAGITPENQVQREPPLQVERARL